MASLVNVTTGGGHTKRITCRERYDFYKRDVCVCVYNIPGVVFYDQFLMCFKTIFGGG